LHFIADNSIIFAYKRGGRVVAQVTRHISAGKGKEKFTLGRQYVYLLSLWYAQVAASNKRSIRDTLASELVTSLVANAQTENSLPSP
jgi:hypothetical protein